MVRASGSFSDRHGGLLRLEGVEVLDSPARKAYCLGYQGPAQPSKTEMRYRSGEEEPPEYRDQACSLVPGVPFICLHPYDSIVMTARTDGTSVLSGWSEEKFELPSPYFARDILEFGALDRTAFIVVLPDRRAYAVENGKARVIDEAVVDWVQAGLNNEVYYRHRGPTAKDGTGSRHALKRVDKSFQSEEIWSSESAELTRIAWVDETVGIWIKVGEELQTWTLGKGSSVWTRSE